MVDEHVTYSVLHHLMSNVDTGDDLGKSRHGILALTP